MTLEARGQVNRKILHSGRPGQNNIFCDLDGIRLNSLNPISLTCKLRVLLTPAVERIKGARCAMPSLSVAHCPAAAALRLEPRSLTAQPSTCSVNHTTS